MAAKTFGIQDRYPAVAIRDTYIYTRVSPRCDDRFAFILGTATFRDPAVRSDLVELFFKDQSSSPSKRLDSKWTRRLDNRTLKRIIIPVDRVLN